MKTPAQLKPLALEAQGQGHADDVRDDVPAGHARDVDRATGSARGGINPDKDVTLITIPPPQMVANMKVGKMDGFCVGEPWNARAIADGIGFTAITTQQIWKDHPEKVLAFTAEFADEEPATVQAVMRAVARGEPVHRQAREPAARRRGRRAGRSTSTPPKEVILGRLLGDYDYGDGRTEKDPHYMTFFDRADRTSRGSRTGSGGSSQFRRWGMVGAALDYQRHRRPGAPARHLPRGRQGARRRGAARRTLKPETLFDGVAFDPAEPGALRARASPSTL